MKYLKRFSKWSTEKQLKVSDIAFKDAKLSYIDTIACILGGQKHPITKKIGGFVLLIINSRKWIKKKNMRFT